ncbi:MAG TPA: hypothetical protein DCZ92_11000 [Elusimicrobia bacterium]|nr:MAG: hypothetical protein A2016_00630 [Elusimicrobia bacterium GWF2_62_30]HBA61321.1 hypothetical protein [Elusimicrobiota bacterium]
MDWFLGPFKKFYDISGRAGRAEFWPFAAANAVLILALEALDQALYGANAYAFSAGYIVLVFVPFFSLVFRRLRDAGRSLYWIFLLLNVIGWVILLALLAGPSAPAPAAAPEEEADPSDSLVKTLAALFCYGVTLYWIYSLALEMERCGSPAWLQYAVVAVPFLYLVSRLYTERKRPWPDGSGIILSAYVAAILLTAISYPYFSGLIRKSTAGATAAKLQEMRASLEENVKANNMVYPADISAVIPAPPELKLPLSGHPPSKEIRVAAFTDIQDSGRWLYDGTAIRIDCTHPDPKGVSWSTY